MYWWKLQEGPNALASIVQKSQKTYAFFRNTFNVDHFGAQLSENSQPFEIFWQKKWLSYSVIKLHFSFLYRYIIVIYWCVQRPHLRWSYRRSGFICEEMFHNISWIFRRCSSLLITRSESNWWVRKKWLETDPDGFRLIFWYKRCF